MWPSQANQWEQHPKTSRNLLSRKFFFIIPHNFLKTLLKCAIYIIMKNIRYVLNQCDGPWWLCVPCLLPLLPDGVSSRERWWCTNPQKGELGHVTSEDPRYGSWEIRSSVMLRKAVLVAFGTKRATFRFIWVSTSSKEVSLEGKSKRCEVRWARHFLVVLFCFQEQSRFEYLNILRKKREREDKADRGMGWSGNNIPGLEEVAEG